MQGEEYIGFVNNTVTGRSCLNWNYVDTENLDEHQILSVNYLRQENADHNYCRNPKALFDSPSCFVQSGNMIILELCDVPICGMFHKIFKG